MDDEQRERYQTETFVIEERAGRHADGPAGDRELVRCQAERSGGDSGHGAERPEKIHIGQLFDFVRLEGEGLDACTAGARRNHRARKCTIDACRSTACAVQPSASPTRIAPARHLPDLR